MSHLKLRTTSLSASGSPKAGAHGPGPAYALRRLALIVLLAFAGLMTISVAHASLTVYTNPDPSKCPASKRYAIKVRQGTGAWKTAPVYDFFGASVNYNNELTAESHVATFDSSGNTQVQITVTGVTVSGYVVRPKSKNVVASRIGNVITLTMTDATRQICLEVNGEVKQPLVIASNPPETNIPSKTDPNVRYVGPGFTDWGHVTDLASNQTVYIAGGAVLRADFAVDTVNNLTIRGHGILINGGADDDRASTLNLVRVTNSRIQDVIILSHNEGYVIWLLAGNNNVTISNVKAFGKIRDGIDPNQSVNITLQDCFIMAHDDTIAVVVHNWGDQPDMDGLLVQRCILAQMGGGNPFRIYGDAAPTRNLRNVTATDVDVIYALATSSGDDYWSTAIFEFSTEGGGKISNVLFDNIRIEKVTKPFLLDIRPHNGGGVNEGGTIDGVRLRNVQAVESPVPPSRILGISDAPIRNVFLESLSLLGTLVTNAASGNIAVGAYTSNITYNQSGPANGTYQILARHSGKALEVAGGATGNGSNVDQSSYTGATNQQWVVTYLGNNQYKIIGKQSGKSLDVANVSPDDGANVQLWAYGGGDNQKWILSATGNGNYSLRAVHSGKALDVSGVSTADGANVQQWTYGGGDNQKWSFLAP